MNRSFENGCASQAGFSRHPEGHLEEVHYEITVAALEDKIVQHAVVTILNQIYEEDFRGFSYGFRPGRSQHQALDALSYALTQKRVNYVLDADIRGFLDPSP